MASKNQATATEKEEKPPVNSEDTPAPDYVPDVAAGEFNLDEEFKPTPLVPGGKYYGNVMKVTRDKEKQTILWEVVLAENGGMCSDGETPVDGRRLFTRNYLPKPGDESEMTSDGSMNKRQAKVNMTKKFADDMKISMNSLAIIDRAIAESEWIGKPVIMDVTVREYEGRFSNDIKRMVAKEQ